MTRIRAFGADPIVNDDDYRHLLTACSGLLSRPVASMEVWRPTTTELPSTNVKLGHLLLGRTETSRIIGFKRCRQVQDYINRELFVARLRQMFGINDYPIAFQTGLRLREGATGKNLSEISGWESTPFILVDFGQDRARYRLHGKHNPDQSCAERRCLPQNEIPDVGAFFRQFGELAAFDYLLGSPDRHGTNYVFDTLTDTLYSIDHEEGPYSDVALRLPPDTAIREIGRTAKWYVPAASGLAIRQVFDDAFVSKWKYIKDHQNLNRDDDTADNRFFLNRLVTEDPVGAAQSINF